MYILFDLFLFLYMLIFLWGLVSIFDSNVFIKITFQCYYAVLLGCNLIN